MKSSYFTYVAAVIAWFLFAVGQTANADQNFQKWSEKDLLRTGRALSVGNNLTSSLHQSVDVDCSKFTSYKQISQYEDSVMALAKTNVTEAIRVLSAQRTGLSQSREQLGNDLTRFVRAGEQANNIANTLRGIDNFLGMVPVSGVKANIISDKGWKVPLDIAGKGAGVTGAVTKEGTALNMWSNVASRTLTPEITTGLGSFKAVARVPAYLLSEGMYAPRTIADAKAMETVARINLITIQESRLQQLQGKLLAEAIKQNNVVNLNTVKMPEIWQAGMGYIRPGTLQMAIPNVIQQFNTKISPILPQTFTQSFKVETFNGTQFKTPDFSKFSAPSIPNYRSPTFNTPQFQTYQPPLIQTYQPPLIQRYQPVYTPPPSYRK